MSIITSNLFSMTGGIVLPDHKSRSSQSPISFAGIPDELVLPIPQINSYRLSVEVGQSVLKGEVIAVPTTDELAAIHTPTSGVIIAIEDRPTSHESGLSAPCIVLQADGKDEWIKHQGVADYQALSAPELISLIEAAGIIGLGGAGFSSSKKLTAGCHQHIDTLIINAAECEPYITADDRLIQERATEVIQGINILQHIIKPKQKTIIAIEDNKVEALSALQNAINGTSVDIAVIPTKYPSGGEKQLIQILTGKEVPTGLLPIDIGIICFNVSTAYAVNRAILHGEPLISRVTTISGDACKEPQNYEVLLGTPIQFLMSQSGIQNSQEHQIIIGGPMMGYVASSTDIPIIKTSNGVLLQPHNSESSAPAQACIRCGHCAEVCPASLLPQQLYLYAQKTDAEKLNAHNLVDCIECGACAYVCPSQIPLVHYFRAAKSEISIQVQAKENADYYKARFDTRLLRIERLEKEKAAAKLARQEAAKKSLQVKTTTAAKEPEPKNAKLDVIQAAIERAKAKKLAQQRDAGLTNNSPKDSQQ